MKIWLTGKDGQLGSELTELFTLDPKWNVMGTTADDLDLTNVSAVERFFADNHFDAVVNCAAYTAVDLAESNKRQAYKVNTEAPELLANLGAHYGRKLLHFSTDYVFDGKNHKPYLETDEPRPNGVYGHSKLKGEEAVQQSSAKALIIRTSWVYSSYGHNFVKTMLRLGQQKKELGVVADQIGSPTYAKDLATTAIHLLENEELAWERQIYHFSNWGACSWFDLAVAVLSSTQSDCHIKPITSAEYPTPAVRPHFSVLDSHKIANECQVPNRHWREALAECLAKIDSR